MRKQLCIRNAYLLLGLNCVLFHLYNAAEGEDITMYILLKTDDEKILARQVKGAEAAIVKKNEGVVSSLDQVLELYFFPT